MRNYISIIFLLALFVSGCKKETDIDPRDKFVGEYEGKTNNIAQNPDYVPGAKLKLSKHPSIDNVLVVDMAKVEYIHTNGGIYGPEYYSEYHNYPMYIYLSDEGFLYLKGTSYSSLHKNCYFVDPDSLYTTVRFYDNGIPSYEHFFKLKKK